ncbi:hypothetical protein K440DRAFT_639092 [Wilcoxina mikolae CBS 423.85]|nr:hypothetical protein K440DRAFT_639092 [Wilcoxina mikolae CBS 423.85]
MRLSGREQQLSTARKCHRATFPAMRTLLLVMLMFFCTTSDNQSVAQGEKSIYSMVTAVEPSLLPCEAVCTYHGAGEIYGRGAHQSCQLKMTLTRFTNVSVVKPNALPSKGSAISSHSMAISPKPTSGGQTMTISKVTTVIKHVYTESSRETSHVFTFIGDTSPKATTTTIINIRPSRTPSVDILFDDSRHWNWIVTTNEMWMISGAVLGAILVVSIVTAWLKVFHETQIIRSYRLTFTPEEFLG